MKNLKEFTKPLPPLLIQRCKRGGTFKIFKKFGMETPESQQFDNPEYLSPQRFEELKQELEEKKQQRLEIAKIIESARGQGDLMENTEYDSAKNKQGENESRIMELEDILRRAVIISNWPSVRVQKDGSNTPEEYFLVGPEEANPLEGKISNESPLGKALLGRKKDDHIEILTPNGKIKYTIIDVK
jgi:transcription elongation factor GreA